MTLDRYLTPYKLGVPVLTGSGTAGASDAVAYDAVASDAVAYDALAVDCPFVFGHGDAFYMMFAGFDGVGYQTGLARSADLLHWEKLGVLLRRGEGSAWDARNAAGTWLLCENDLYGLRTLKRWRGRYWMAYHSYPGDGYETGPARIGLAWCEDEDLMTWHRLARPILTPETGAAWEAGGLYKECLFEHEGQFYLFYNAKDREQPWTEQTGVAIAPELVAEDGPADWRRYGQNPVVRVTAGSWDSRFCSDPCVVRDGDRWVMFYFGYDGRHAQEGIAFSDDLLSWEKHPEPILTIGTEGELDSIHAHKPSVITHNGVLYHFYCACRPSQPGDSAVNAGNEFRTITVATSEPR